MHVRSLQVSHWHVDVHIRACLAKRPATDSHDHTVVARPSSIRRYMDGTTAHSSESHHSQDAAVPSGVLVVYERLGMQCRCAASFEWEAYAS